MSRYTVTPLGPNTYRAIDSFGRKARITGPTAPTDRDLDDLFTRMFPAPTVPAGTEKTGLLGRAADWAGDAAGALLELANRPDEAVMGTLSGATSALRQGQGVGTALREGLQRGARALTESVPQGQVTESGYQLLREAGVPTKRATLPTGTQIPLDVINAEALGPRSALGAAALRAATTAISPAATLASDVVTKGLGGVPLASAGMGLDFLLSPYNLLGPVGPVRTAAAKGLRAAGLGAKAADVVSLSRVPAAYKATVVEPVKRAGRALLETPLLKPLAERMAPTRGLGQLAVGTEGLTVEDLYKFTQRQVRGESEQAAARWAEWEKTHNLSDAEAELLTFAREYPKSRAAQQVASDPRLSQALTELAQKSHESWMRAVAQRQLPAMAQLDLNASKKTQGILKRNLQQLGKAEEAGLAAVPTPGAAPPVLPLTLLEQAARGDAAALQAVQADPDLAQLYTTLVKSTQRLDTSSGQYRGQLAQFADLSTLKFATDPKTKRIVPLVSTEVPNYIAHAGLGSSPLAAANVTLSRDLRPMLGASKDRSQTLAERLETTAKTAAQQFGKAPEPPPDVRATTLMRRREQAGIRAAADTKFLEDTAQQIGLTMPAPGYAKLPDADIQKLPETLQPLFTTTYLPEQLLAEMQRTTARITDPEFLEGALSRTMRLMKTWQTTYNVPGHQLKNGAGNVVNMATEEGMDLPKAIAAYARGMQLVMRPNARFRPITIRWTDGTTRTLQTRDEFLKFAESLGIVGKNSADIAEAAKRQPKGLGRLFSGPSPLNPDTKTAQRIRQWNQRFIEDPAKLGLFLWNLEQGRTVEKSSTSVFKRLFDYFDLPEWERQRLAGPVPFYTWTRKNIPLQVSTLLERPGIAGRTRQTLNAFWNASEVEGEPSLRAENIDAYRRGADVVPLPGVRDVEGNRILVRAPLPFFDVRLLTPTAESAREQLSEKISPFIQAGVEQWTGRDLQTGLPLNTRMVPAGPQARALSLIPELTGLAPSLAVGRTPTGPKTTAERENLLRYIPVPAGGLLRSIPAEGDTDTLSFIQEAILRSGGLQPAAANASMRQRAAKARTRARQEQQRESANLRTFQRLQQRQLQQ